MAAAQPAEPDVNGAEFSCMKAAVETAGKLYYARTKCEIRCVKAVWRNNGLDADCQPPYGGRTAECMARAEAKFVKKWLKACDPATDATRDCPECYSGGDCSASGEAAARASLIANESDTYFPGFLCERAGATTAEQRCQQATAKAIGKIYGPRLACYQACFFVARKGVHPMSDCLPPTSDVVTANCIDKVAAPYLEDIDQHCTAPGAAPDGCGGAYPTSADWDNLDQISVAYDVGPTFCSE
jgi:hypothetical protein